MIVLERKGYIMKTQPLSSPERPKNTSRIFDTTEPQLRLKTMGEDEFERVVGEWAYSCLRKEKKYSNVALLGGSGDSGRDLVAYIDDNMQKFDIYQCKRYEKPLSPSTYMIEFGKLCYYTYIGEYVVPNKYYIVASNGIGQSLRKLIEHPKQINTELINTWDEKCGKKRQIIAEGIKMTDSLRKYIEEFDFSIVSDIAPITLLDEFSKSPWYKYHFGGGIKKRPTFEKPSEQLKKSEKTMPYVKQLLKVYSKEAGQVYETQEDLKNNQKLYKHFMRQREGFFSAQSLKRFARDELLNEDSYNSLKGQVEFGIMDVYENEYSSELERVKETTKQANSLGVSCEEIKDVTIYDKTGMCHELVNDEKIIWSDIDENI
jgi:hypothetical protein